MTRLQQLSQNLKTLQKRASLYGIALRIAKRFEAYLIDLNQLQLSEGQNIFGQIVGTYSPATEEIAKSEPTVQPKIAGQNYNFEWTGAFFGGMRIKFTQDYLEFTSTAGDTDEILAAFSSSLGDQELLGLTEKSLDEFLQDKLIPEFRQEICEIMGIST